MRLLSRAPLRPASFTPTGIRWRLPKREFGSNNSDDVPKDDKSFKSSRVAVYRERPQRLWSETEKQTLCKLHEEGTPWKVIAQILKRTYSSARSQYYKVILPQRTRAASPPTPRQHSTNRPWTAEDDTYMHKLASERKSLLQAASILNRTAAAVKQRYSKCHPPEAPYWPLYADRAYTTQDDQQLFRLKLSGLSNKQVAKSVGRSIVSVKHRWAAIRPLITSDILANRLDPTKTLSLSSADLQYIATKRRDGLSWHSLNQLRWPDTRPDTLADAFLRESMLREDLEEWRHDPRFTGHGARKLDLSPDEFHEALKLRKDGKSWTDIANLKHPSYSWQTIARAVRRHMIHHQTKEVEMLVSKRKTLDLLDDAYERISKMRQDGISWETIRELAFPGCSTRTISAAFHRADKKRKK